MRGRFWMDLPTTGPLMPNTQAIPSTHRASICLIQTTQGITKATRQATHKVTQVTRKGLQVTSLTTP